jgi:hypothetical protein
MMTMPIKRAHTWAAAAVAVTLALLMVTPAQAAKKSEPVNTGVVERLDTIGGHTIEPIPIDVGGEVRSVLTVVGWDAALPDEDDDGFGAYCADQPPVFNGVEQFLVTPSGNLTVVVHNADIPVLLFDVTGVDDEDDFLEKCSAGELEPLAQGTVKQRPIIHETDRGFTIKVKSSGVVTDTSDQQWRLQAFLRLSVDFATGEETVTSWITLGEL